VSAASVVSTASVVVAAGSAVAGAAGVAAGACVDVAASSSSLPHAAVISDRLITLASAMRLFGVFTLNVSLWIVECQRQRP
jgi:hypothetical protein